MQAMIAGLMMLVGVGQVAAPGLVRVTEPVSVGTTLKARRLEPAVGAPGRAPFFRWSEAGRLRVVGVRADGTAEVALVRGQVAAGDRVEVD
jgi:hypothetical protein